jgi:histidinol-phosphate/aromatic aminotransferase/cobyric acid decarboxylase-like protein
MTTPDIAGLCERLRVWPSPKIGADYSVASIQAQMAEAADTLERQAAEIERLRKALKPFAAAGQAIDANGFGVAIFPNDSRAFESSWSENGQDHQLTWGDFRRAALTGEDT